MLKKLEKEFRYYLEHQNELVKKHSGKFIVIKDLQVIGEYDTEVTAITETVKKGHELGTFLVQKCEPGADSYTQTFHSRISVA